MSVFVCGATGTQGGAIAKYLHEKGIKVHTITRTPLSTKSQHLRALGADVIAGDYDNEASLRSSLANCTGLFLNMVPDFQNPDIEVIRGRRLLTLAKEAGVKHVVYSSAFAVNEPHKIRTFTPTGFVGKLLLPKQALENEVRTMGFERWTIMRPGSFMTNFLAPMVYIYSGLVDKGCWVTAWTKETKIPLVDPMDIGRVGAVALTDKKFHGKEIEIAGELLTVEEMVKELVKATGRDLKAAYLTEEEIKAQAAVNPLVEAQLALRDMAQFADLEKTKEWGLDLGTFERFLKRENEKVMKTFSI
ncbi:NAD dependent epimerase/dehydratase [Aspergillus eucalypticola CBS 122712]|uniref:NAD dependent epimerase/dehydratase n=1 Tax=Aspergillus eucalypticola (strain CBS 122712 / IBT 29274) TaxID=1448314 RepID=A0A317VNR7_ASPEC|nr:NAD dependent epimerase/dehydratase [Aspergillus eucalypticola CBS 122712]PWY74891.1 NAD dependent epimerase/dehydratase [Aspergillus eucalypticola CBS 122712]